MPQDKKKGVRIVVHDLETGEQLSSHEIVSGFCCCTTYCSIGCIVEKQQ
jgi:hypothetical protein